MIFLDANAFYSYYGRSSLGMTSSPVDEEALRQYLDGKNNKSLPTSVFIEIVTHFRNDPQKLKSVLRFREEKGLILYNNIPYYVVNPDELTCVHLMGEGELSGYAKRVLQKKIEIESKFTLLFYEITRDLYAHYKLESTKELSEDNKDSVLSYIGRDIYRQYGSSLEQELIDELTKGYDEKKEQKVLKEFYIQKLNEACLFIDIIIAGSEACKDEKSDLIKEIQDAYKHAINSGMDGENGTMPNIVDTLSTNESFLDNAKRKIAAMFKKGHYSDAQVLYLRYVMFGAWFDRAQKLRKNDIFDMFCVGCLDCKKIEQAQCVLVDNSSYLISFDSTMKEFIGRVKPNNLQLIENIK